MQKEEIAPLKSTQSEGCCVLPWKRKQAGAGSVILPGAYRLSFATAVAPGSQWEATLLAGSETGQSPLS